MSDVPDFSKLPRILDQNGIELLPIEKYLFCMEDVSSHTDESCEIQWKCNEFKKKNCPARVCTDRERKVLKVIGEHTHLSDPDQFDQLQLKTIVMHLAKHTEWDHGKIHKNIEIIFGKDKAKQHSKASLDRLIRKTRGNIRKRYCLF